MLPVDNQLSPETTRTYPDLEPEDLLAALALRALLGVALRV